MTFPFSLAVAFFAIFAGCATAGIFYFTICLILRKTIKASRVSFFIVSLAVLIGIFAWFLVSFRNTNFSLFKTSDWIFVGINFALGIALMMFTKICLLGLLPAYLVFAFLAFLSLNSIFPRKTFFEYKVESKENNQAVIVCHEVSPYVILPMPRIWYELQSEEQIQINPLYSFMKNTLLTKSQNVTVKFPQKNFYPVLYKLNIQSSATNLVVKAEPIL